MYEPRHDVTDSKKLQRLIDALERGERLPPVVVQGEIALTGVHRLAAYKALNMAPDVVEVSDDEYRAALIELGLDEDATVDEIWDLDLFLETLHSLTKNERLQKALEGQY